MPDLPVTHCVVALPEIGVSTPQAFRDWDLLHSEPAGPAPGLSLSAALDISLTGPRPSDRLSELSRTLTAALCEPHSSGVFTLDEGLAEISSSPASFLTGLSNPLLALVRTGIENDFEEVVFPKYPLLGDIKRVLAASDLPDQGALYASLSGSGSALFGLYGAEEAAESAVVRLQERGVRSLLTKTLPRPQYWRSMVVK
jgi:4-diphosphocytidyl-2-C-methyl-D-erythritol kinase